ncbi:MAG: Insertion element protein, partial [Cyanobacteria bacterium 0813]|nr:Insertion element protein [Cyanobacteria bacterium 0813]
ANQVAELLKAEHKSIDERIARFSTVAELFQERRNVAFNSTTSPAAALSQSAQNEVTPVSEASLATVAVNQNVAEQNLPEIISALNSNAIESLDVLKNILLEIIESAKIELKEDAIPLVKVKKDFVAKYQSHADLVVKSFMGKKSSLIKYLQSESGVFEVKLIGQEHQVALVAKKSSN